MWRGHWSPRRSQKPMSLGCRKHSWALSLLLSSMDPGKIVFYHVPSTTFFMPNPHPYLPSPLTGVSYGMIFFKLLLAEEPQYGTHILFTYSCMQFVMGHTLLPLSLLISWVPKTMGVVLPTLHSKNLKGFLLLSLLTHERILKVENISLSTYQEDKLFNYSSFSWTWTQHTDQTPRSKVQEATQGLPVEKRSVGYVTIIARQHWKDKHARSSSWVTDPVANGLNALVQCGPHALVWPYLILNLARFFFKFKGHLYSLQ